MIGTRILKNDLEIDILLLHRDSEKNDFVKGGNFDLNYLSYF